MPWYLFLYKESMKKIAIIGTAGTPCRYGGFETLADHLVQQWEGEFEVTVYCSTKVYPKEERIKTYHGARMIYLPFDANGVQSIIYDIISIFHALFYANTLLVLGVSGGIVLPLVKFFTKKKIIVNIDGLEWRRPKWNKWVRKFLKFSEFLAVKFSDADITDNYALKKYTAKSYQSLSYLVAYGGDHVIPVNIEPNHLKEYPFLEEDYAFKVCRIEPENNVHTILEAFTKTNGRLVVVGNWKNSDYGIELKKEYSSYKNINLLDPIYDQKSLDLLRSNASLYIHGHSAGGTNPSLVEAMYLGLPIFIFDAIYNHHTTFFTAPSFKNSEELRKLIIRTSKMELNELGFQMKSIAIDHYTWSVIANKYKQLILSFDFQYKKKQVRSRWKRMKKKKLSKLSLAHLSRNESFSN